MLETQTPKKVDLNSEKIWNNCLTNIKRNVSQMTFNTWFLPIKPIDINNSTLKVLLPSQFFWEWIDEHFNSLIHSTITSVIGPDANLAYIIADEKDEEHNPVFVKQEKAVKKSVEIEKPDFETYINPRYTFDNFIKGEGNQLARAAAGAIGDNPGGTSFNPLFVYGGVGLGKTHLVQAIGNKIIQNFPLKKAIYLSSDIFTIEFVEAIQSNKVNEFSNFYRSMDVLILDDIQFLIGKEKTQDLFFHIFNTLHQSGKQIILTSDKPPKDLKGMDDRLISRFQWGLSADIQPPDFETRNAILRRKAEEFGLALPTEIFEYIASHIVSNIRELEGCLIKLLANASLNSKKIDFDLVKTTVKEIATSRQVNVTIENITSVVCSFLNVGEDKIRDKTRKKEVVLARQIAMFLAKDLTRSSLKTIGLHFGGRDHSTVIHACTSVEKNIIVDESMKELVKKIKEKIELDSV